MGEPDKGPTGYVTISCDLESPNRGQDVEAGDIRILTRA